MSNIDLGTAQGFAAATLSPAATLLNQLQGLNSDQWDIQESAYGHPPSPLVLFHVFKSKVNYNGAVDQVTDNISRRVPIFEFPYVDGQTTDDLGRNGESFDFNILIFGPQYYAAYQSLIKEFNNPVPGTLVHPVRGRMTAKFQRAQVTHKSSQRQAVLLRATFVEHNFEVSFQASKPTTKSALSSAVGFIGQISSVLTSIQSNLIAASQIKTGITSAISSYSTLFTGALVALNTSFNSGSSTDLPALLPTNPGNGSSNSSVTAFPSAAAPNDPYSGVSSSTVAAAQSPVLSPSQATDLVASVFTAANSAIQAIESANDGQGALQFYAETLTIRQSITALQSALTLCLQTSNAAILSYTTPRLMSIREVCFANGLTPDDSETVLTLNPSLLSANYIPQGTVLQVPSS